MIGDVDCFSGGTGMVKINTENTKVLPISADTKGMGMFSTVEVATRIGVTPRRVRQIAIDQSIGRIIGHSRIFTEVEIDEIRWYTLKGDGHKKMGRPGK